LVDNHLIISFELAKQVIKIVAKEWIGVDTLMGKKIINNNMK
jgi:hypothetical protein